MKTLVQIASILFFLLTFTACHKYEVKYHANLAQNISQEDALFLLIDGNHKGMIPFNSNTDLTDDTHSMSLDFGYGRYVLKVQDAFGKVKSSFVLFIHKNRIRINSKTGSGHVMRNADHLSIQFSAE